MYFLGDIITSIHNQNYYFIITEITPTLYLLKGFDKIYTYGHHETKIIVDVNALIYTKIFRENI